MTVGDLPPYSSSREELTQLLAQTDFARLFDKDLESGLDTMLFATWQLRHLASVKLKEHLKIQYSKALSCLASQMNLNSNPNGLNIDIVTLRLVEVSLNIAHCQNTMSGTILEIKGLLLETVSLMPETVPFIRNMVQAMCEELPLEHGQHFGELLLLLRTK